MPSTVTMDVSASTSDSRSGRAPNAETRRTPLGQRLRFSRGLTVMLIGVPTKPNSSRSRRSMNRS